MPKHSAAKDPPSAVATNALWVETILRFNQTIPVPKPFTQSLSTIQSAITLDPQHFNPSGSKDSAAFLKNLNDHEKAEYANILRQMVASNSYPSQKSSFPLTSSQEYGFYRESKKARQSRNKHTRTRKRSAETEFASRFEKLIGQSPFMLHVKRKSDQQSTQPLNQASYMDLTDAGSTAGR